MPASVNGVRLLDAAAAAAAPRSAGRERIWTYTIGLSCSFSYALTYFWRYPVFVLPADILQQPVVGALDLQACFSLAFILGFGLAKPFAATLVASPFFFRHRLLLLLLLITVSMLVEGFGLALSSPLSQIAAVFFSAFLSSWIYGLML